MKWIFITLLILLTSFKEKPGCAQLDIILLGDFSGSVQGREKFVVDAFSTFINQFELSEATVKIGMIMFNDNAYITSPLTSNKDELVAGFNKIASTTASGGTEMVFGLRTAYGEILSKKGRDNIQKIIILVSDGDPDDHNKEDEIAMIKQMGEGQFVSICSIVITQSGCDRDFMKEISNGCYSEADYMSLAYELKNLDICL